MNKKGFTLVEVLTAVLIVIILVTMAVPMYERAVEKSHKAEVSVNLKRLSESKIRTMTARNIYTFGDQFTLNQLDMTNPDSKDFKYSLSPVSFPNDVCAKRCRGDYKGTVFLYLGEESCDCNNINGFPPCMRYCAGEKLLCSGPGCDAYGMTDTTLPTGVCNSAGC